MREFVGARDQIEVNAAVQIGVPGPHRAGVAADGQEQHGNAASHSPCGNALTPRGGEEERAGGGAFGDAIEAASALGRLDGDEAVQRQRGRAGFRAFAAINAQVRVAVDAQRLASEASPVSAP